MAFNSLVNRKLRSWLTIIGIVIGVAAVVALVSIGQGLQNSVEAQLSDLGADMIFIMPTHTKGGETFGGHDGGGGFVSGGLSSGTISGNLTENDLRFIKSVPGVYLASGMISKQATIKYISETATIGVQGADSSLQKVFTTVHLEEGRYLLSGDDAVAVLGHQVATDLFKTPVKLNSPISINGNSVRVIGILKAATQSSDTNNVVIIPMQTARRIFSDFPSDQFSYIIVKTSESADPAKVAEQITKKMYLSHHVTKDTQDFTVMTSQSILETVGKILSSIKLFLGGIAAISLAVGGIGIANTMFMSVMERTRQIGVLKSLGATNLDVSELFLAESAIMGMVGGIIGVGFGYIVSAMLSKISFFGSGGGGGMQTSVPLELALFAVGFSVLIGIVSGLLPARKAAKLQPTEALRYE